MTVLVSPEGSSAETLSQLAPRRFESLDGKRIGLLGNTKLNADEILGAIGDLLSERYKVEAIVHRRKPTFSQPAPPELVDEMVAGCDVVLAGVGDWGSCSAASVADGTIFEKRGVVAASIVTHTFIRAADAMGRRNGFPGYKYAVMPNPIGNLKPDQVKQRAKEVLPQVLEIIGLGEEQGPK